jgi:signal transduction histidine kinase
MQALLQIGSQNLEPLDIPAAAWPVLVEGGWQHLSLTGDWFGHAVNSELSNMTPTTPGLKKSNALVFQINSGTDVHLALCLTHSAHRGEGRLFAEQLARVFVLLMETGLRARTEAMSLALAERARLSLYLQHDMRNLAQWVAWVCADFATCAEPQALLIAACRLQENAPLAQERAHRLIAALGEKPQIERAGPVDLRQAITQAAHLAGIEVTLIGQAQAWIACSLLARVLDNLFSNLAPNWREALAEKPVLQLQTTEPTDTLPAMAEINFFSAWPEPGARIAPEKLFEPFASGRPGGLGLGLYQARKSLREAGGELRAQAAEEGLSFLLLMPARAP